MIVLKRYLEYTVLTAIMVLAAVFRLTGQNWDDNQNLHPDERFVTMVGTGIRWPSSIGQYFDSATSPLNPYNNNYGSFIYGNFPLFLGKAVAGLTDHTVYGNYHLATRGLSAACDLVTVLLLFFVGRRLFGTTVGLVASFLLACTVLHIQLSHFGTFDTFAAMLCLATFHFALRANENGKWYDYGLAGIAAGLAVASKLSALPIIAVFGLPLLEQIRIGGIDSILRRPKKEHLPPLIGLALALVVAIWTFRIGQPYAFLGPSPFSFRLDPRWTSDLQYWSDVQSGLGDAPPAVQWANRSPLFVFDFLVRWGMGPALGIAALVGLGLAGLRAITAFRLPPTWLLVLVIWPASNLAYFGFAWLKTNRYLLPIYPFLVLLAAALLVELWRRGRATSIAWQKWQLAPLLIVGVFTFLYAVSFTTIYTRPVTRVAASEWIYQNIPLGSQVANEHWDDGLPLGLPDQPSPSEFPGTQLELYNPDSPEKLEMMLAQLDQVDYIFLTSNRLYGSIPRIPERYPMTIEYYRALFAGELGFELVQTFTSRPQLLGVELVDDAAEESFTVYDHPKVMIFQKTPNFDVAAVEQQLAPFLMGDIANIRSSQAGFDLLMLDEEDRVSQQAGGTWSGIFDRNSLANSYPTLMWYLAIQLMALAAFPLCWRLLRRLPDGGVAVSKTIGILGAGYVAWMVASLGLMDFGRVAVLLGIGVMAICSMVAIGRHWRGFMSDLRRRWQAVVFTEALFLGAFLLFVLFRSINPDLWHPARGGEKPMEFAYFNAVIRSSSFPAYDPWFAGGYLNYYYFGYVLMASIVRLTGIVPAVSFNLAVATCFALAVVNSWSFVCGAIGALRRELRIPTRLGVMLLGLTGPLFVVLIGNFDMARRIGMGELGYPAVEYQGALSLGHFGDVIRGVWRAATDHHTLPTDAYWAPTRVIDGAINEFPYFSFLFADLHPHMMSIAFSLGVLVLILGTILSRTWPDPLDAPVEGNTPVYGISPGWWSYVKHSPRRMFTHRVGMILLLALASGALYPLNTWDYPTYLVISFAGFFLLDLLGSALERRIGDPVQRWDINWPTVRRAAISSAAIVLLGRLFFLPYFQHYATPNQGFDPWLVRTPPDQYLIVHGVLLFFVITFLVGELFTALWERRPAPARPVAPARQQVPSGAAAFVNSELMRLEALDTWALPGLLTVAIAGGLSVLAVLSDKVLILIFALLTLVIAVAWVRRHEPIRLALVGLTGVALMITALVEMYTLRGDIGRMNTVFKFYLQVWTLLGLVAAVGVVITVLQHLRRVDRVGRATWGLVAIVVLAAGLVYPALATGPRLDDRFTTGLPRTLDGQAYMPNAVFDDSPDGRPQVSYSLNGDYLAINWLLDNVQGSPVILEAQTPEYRWGSRISVNTGLPTVIGWNWHQSQQRAGYGELIERRRQDVQRIFNDAVPFETIAPLLDRYGVQYIYVGAVERAYYEESGLVKFTDAANSGELDLVYDAEGVQIYQYTPIVTDELEPVG